VAEILREAIMTNPQIEQQIQSAVRLHQTGRFTEAESAYRALLVQWPNHPELLQLLGALAGQTNRVAEAIDLIARAIAVNPSNPIYHCNISEMYRRLGQNDQAIAHARRAIQLEPNLAKAYCNLGAAQRDAGHGDDAISAFRRAVELRPNFLEAINNLGHVYRSKQQYPEAIAAYRQTCALDPKSPDAFINLGIALREDGQNEEAFTALHRAIELKPDTALAHNNLGVAYSESVQLDKALEAFTKAIQLHPGYALAHKNLGVALAELRRYSEAVASFDRAIELNPNLPEAHALRALIYLVQGDFDRGLPEYEWRWRAQLRDMTPLRDFAKPQWDGSELAGKTILLHAEQGYGDTLQFIRYAALVAARGGRIVFECQPALFRLLRAVEGIDRIFPAGETLPGFDLHCPLLSLPLAFKTRLDSIPAKVPYVFADPASVESWKSRMRNTPGRKIGLAWAGNPRHKLTRHRAITLMQLAPLAQATDAVFFSMQKGPAAKQDRPAGMNLIDCGDQLHDFADTAGLIANLDLVITVDTAVAHLAGAMGKPVSILIPFSPDWRWLLDRTDSPWYPTIRLFRQKSLALWDDVIQTVANELQGQSA
jgi:tetratricopeptide (TPR) repeat protein